jgi:hypothetical protein
MTKRTFVAALLNLALLMFAPIADADSSSPQLASYYDRHMALQGDVAFGWVGRGEPRRLRAGVVQVGVDKDGFLALLSDGTLIRWTDRPEAASTLMRGVARFAAGASGWFAIDRAAVLWHGGGNASTPKKVADDVVEACIGDSADYYITRDGTLYAHGLAHRGQYGDGKLTTTPGFVATAREASAVKAHTGHALHLRRDGKVMGTGGNRFGPLSTHGLGDKADRWGPLFEGAVAIATGSRHSLAIRADASLWAWGEGFAIEPARIMERVRAVAAGDTATIAIGDDGALWQWDGGGKPRRLAWP